MGHALLLLALAALYLSTRSPAPHARPANDLVVCRGQDLLRRGEPFRFVGANCYRLAEHWESSEELLGTLAAHGVKVVRFWAFQKQCGPSGLDFTRFDVLVTVAQRHDLLLMPVIENHWGACTYGPEIKSREWYESGWRTERLGPVPYLEYLRALATHFRDEPRIVAWQLINEPEIWPESEANFAVLRRFSVDAARELKRADPNHLVSLGLLGLGQPSTAHGRFRALHDCHGIDFVSAHDHGYAFEPMPGRDARKPGNSFYADLLAARTLGKPFLATEVCIPLSWVECVAERRVELFRAKLDAFFAAGGSGYILWNYEPVIESDCGFDADDPLLDLLRETSARLGHGGTGQSRSPS